jgi:hypothetical protein
MHTSSTTNTKKKLNTNHLRGRRVKNFADAPAGTDAEPNCPGAPKDLTNSSVEARQQERKTFFKMIPLVAFELSEEKKKT